MAPLVLGILALIALLFLGQLFIGADPKKMAKALRYTGAVLLGAGALALLTLDRPAVAMLLGSMAWGLFTGGHVWPGGWPYYHMRHRPRRSGGGTASGQTTSVRTEWLELELDHATGSMRGRVFKGRHSGSNLSKMSQVALLDLYREAAPADAETARLLETYLDRTFGPDWRKAEEQDAGKSDGARHRARANGGMTREEAYAVLGLEPGASDGDVRAAHRKLMKQNHPDHGGSSYLAAKINEAKDTLLGA